MSVRGNRLSMTALVCVIVAGVSFAFGEIPPLSKKELHEDASHAFSGKVVETYERTKKSADYEQTHGVAEISVERINKGSEIAVGDRVYVRYWHKRWIGEDPPIPDHYGHWDIPSEADSVVVYVRGDRKTGFDALSPNGFFAVKKAEKSEAGARRSSAR